MPEKIKIKVCSGTMCYIMGGAKIQLLMTYLPPEIQNRVELSGVPCMGMCQSENRGSPPYVTINGQMMENASVEKIIQHINRIQYGIL